MMKAFILAGTEKYVVNDSATEAVLQYPFHQKTFL